MAYTLASKRTWTTHPCSPGQSPFRGCDGLRGGTEAAELSMRRHSFFQMEGPHVDSVLVQVTIQLVNRVSDVLVRLQTRQTETHGKEVISTWNRRMLELDLTLVLLLALHFSVTILKATYTTFPPLPYSRYDMPVKDMQKCTS